jgi:hypothetical protein
MAQTLTALPALSSPFPLTQYATLAQNVAAIQNLDNRMIIALSVVSKIYELAGRGGTDYRNNKAQLRKDAHAIKGAFSWEYFNAGSALANHIWAVLNWNQAQAKDATLSGDVNTLVASMGAERETPETTLWTFYFFLLYQIAAVA